MLRILIIIILLLGIVALGFYAAWRGPSHELTGWDTLAQPEKYAGLTISGSYNRVVGGVENYLVVAPYGHQISLEVGNDFIAKPLDFVSYEGIVQKEGYIKVQALHIHYHRFLKYLASLVPFLVIILWFFKKYRFNFREFYFEERKS